MPLMILGALTSFYFCMHGPEKNMDFVAMLWREALGAKFILPSLASFDLTLVLRIPSVADLMRTFESVKVIEIRFANLSSHGPAHASYNTSPRSRESGRLCGCGSGRGTRC